MDPLGNCSDYRTPIPTQKIDNCIHIPHTALELSCYDLDMKKEKGAKDSDLRERGLSANSGG